MKLILSDRHLDIPEANRPDTTLIDLAECTIANCVGCFGCWTKTPGKCVIRDDAVKIYPLIASSDHVLYVSKICYGSYDTPMKTMLERAIPVQQAFIRLLHGETHHVQRSVLPKEAVIIGYGARSAAEEEIFRRLVARNAHNMCFTSHRVVFTSEYRLEDTVRKEAAAWEKL